MVYGDPLSLMDRGGIAVVDMGVILQIKEMYRPLSRCRDIWVEESSVISPSMPFLTLKFRSFFQEHDPFAKAHVSCSDLELKGVLVSEFSGKF